MAVARQWRLESGEGAERARERCSLARGSAMAQTSGFHFPQVLHSLPILPILQQARAYTSSKQAHVVVHPSPFPFSAQRGSYLELTSSCALCSSTETRMISLPPSSSSSAT